MCHKPQFQGKGPATCSRLLWRSWPAYIQQDGSETRSSCSPDCWRQSCNTTCILTSGYSCKYFRGPSCKDQPCSYFDSRSQGMSLPSGSRLHNHNRTRSILRRYTNCNRRTNCKQQKRERAEPGRRVARGPPRGRPRCLNKLDSSGLELGESRI